MGLINKETKEFEKRDKSTVASFPTLNPEVLAKVYRNINEFYGVDREDWLAQHPDDEKLVSLVKSGNFPKLYAKELFETKTIIKTPEKPEDIEGDWFTYQLGNENELAKAAEGTGWCIADPNVAHNYLSYGNYAGNDNDWEEDEDNSEEDNQNSSKAKFIIFKLKAPNSPDGYSTNGVASIRLNPDGKVAEVSGLDGGQALEDSLVQTVKEKVLSLPGGKEFLQKFEDKQTLIKLDHKLQKGEDLTKEELSFLYELDRPIATLDTYRKDPRITELKEKYGIEYALEKGIDVNKLVSNLNLDSIICNLDTLLKHGADIDVNELVSTLYPEEIVLDLDTLLRNGADIDVNKLVSNLDSNDIARNLDTLLKNGVDIHNIVSNLDPYNIAYKLDTLLKHGADIDVNELVSTLDPYNIARNLVTLLKNGVNIDNILSNMTPSYIVDNLDTLLRNGARIYINALVSNLRPNHIIYNLDTLLKHGADIDVNKLVSNLDPYDIVNNLDTLLKHGADINNVIREMNQKDIEDNIDLLREYGAKFDAYQENN